MSLRDPAVRILQSLPRRARARRRGRTTRWELRSTAGYRVVATLHRPDTDAKVPAVLLCPGTNAPGSVFTGWGEAVQVDELVSLGVAALRFDPAGRGESWGPEDYGGDEHQDNVRVALRRLLDEPGIERVGVLSISLGLTMAVGALARWSDSLPVEFLLDWEGPCDREIITAGGTRMAPALGHRLDDDLYWNPREAVRHVSKLRCGYLRVQAERDHAQPGELRHATRMIEAAAQGQLPWFRLNEHPPGAVPAAPKWYDGGRSAANRVLLSWIRRLLS